MKTNEDLQKDVQDAIKWEPMLHAAEIGVTVKDGIVTLTGTVDSYSKKSEAEEASKKVAGVKAVVEKIEIKFCKTLQTSDNEIASEVINAFKWNWEIPSDKVKVKVEAGWVSLDGNLDWNYQREAAKKVVSKLNGVKGVTNNIRIESETNAEIEKKDIENAISRNWSMNGQDIQVNVLGHKVTLNGIVDSMYQKDEAGRIAWKSPGVWNLDNELKIDYTNKLLDVIM
jgi:osmotically-inducible protein OsmY